MSEARPHVEGDNNTMWLLLLDLYIVIFLSGSGLNARLIVCWLLTSYVMDSSESAIDPLIQLSAREWINVFELQVLADTQPTFSVSTSQPWCLCWRCVLHRAQSVMATVPPTQTAGTQTPSALSSWTSLSWPSGWENWTWSTVHSILRSSSSCWSPTSSSPSCCCSTCWSLWWEKLSGRFPRRARRSGSFRWAGSNTLRQRNEIFDQMMLIKS